MSSVMVMTGCEVERLAVAAVTDVDSEAVVAENTQEDSVAGATKSWQAIQCLERVTTQVSAAMPTMMMTSSQKSEARQQATADWMDQTRAHACWPRYHLMLLSASYRANDAMMMTMAWECGAEICHLAKALMLRTSLMMESRRTRWRREWSCPDWLMQNSNLIESPWATVAIRWTEVAAPSSTRTVRSVATVDYHH